MGLAAMTAWAVAEPVRIVGFGDSLMAGYQLAPGESFPEKLETALKARGHDVLIANAGVSGDTSSGGLSRLDWSVPDDTRIVILELGANDMLRGIRPEVTEKNLVAMIERLRERGIAVVLAGMLAAPISALIMLRNSTRSIRAWPRPTACRSIRSSSTASPPRRACSCPTACTPTPRASTAWWKASCR